MQCPTCGRQVRIRKDGMVGRHTFTKHKERFECLEGPVELKPKGRRVSVEIDVIAPAEWRDQELRKRAGEILRAGLWDVLTADVHVKGAF